jgi:dihydrolipoamide dehydrogenase
MSDRLLPGFDAEASVAVGRSLAARGAEVVTGRKLASMRAGENGVVAELDDGRRLEAGHALIAAGRRPNIEDIGLDNAGVKVADGTIVVDERCRTNVEDIYAAGDVAEKRQYAHLAERMGVIAAENATGNPLCDDRTVVPVGVYTHPEVAAVGLNEHRARERFGRVRVLRHALPGAGASMADSEAEGRVKILADPAAGAIHGALLIGPGATEVIHELALAMKHGITVEQVRQTIHAHPSFAEALRAAADSWVARSRLKQH